MEVATVYIFNSNRAEFHCEVHLFRLILLDACLTLNELFYIIIILVNSAQLKLNPYYSKLVLKTSVVAVDIVELNSAINLNFNLLKLQSKYNVAPFMR